MPLENYRNIGWLISLLSSLVRPKQGPVGTESLTIHMVRGSTDKDL